MTPEGFESFCEAAWRGFILFAWSQPEAHAAFRNHSGLPQRPNTGAYGIDALIDKACGVTEDDDYMLAFVDWATEIHWGTDDAPKKWRERWTEQKQNLSSAPDDVSSNSQKANE